ncbi:hypothetical protein CYMTET_15828, partial [Cymbomonas tetramitiformis]
MRGVYCLVKLGGAAVTYKKNFETLDEATIESTVEQLKDARDHCAPESGIVVVHGAGSFGHFQASEAKVSKGGIQDPHVKAGFVDTRVSVTKLNHVIVEALARKGIPAVGMSPFGSWKTTNRKVVVQHNIPAVQEAVDAGLVPVPFGSKCSLFQDSSCSQRALLQDSSCSQRSLLR